MANKALLYLALVPAMLGKNIGAIGNNKERIWVGSDKARIAALVPVPGRDIRGLYLCRIPELLLLRPRSDTVNQCLHPAHLYRQ